MRRVRHVHGDDLLYRFFQETLAVNPELFAAVPQLLLTTTGIWLPLDLYARVPVLLPWVVRDPSCRGNRRKGIPDAWSSPDARGYMRDDNSLIKGLPRALRIEGPESSHLRGARLGNEFVAAHVWREVGHQDLASRVPVVNSFVPNLVWLPNQVAKLTDRQGSTVQKVLQAMAYQIYREAPVEPVVAERAGEAWALIPEPEIRLASLWFGDLNWFTNTPLSVETRLARIQTELAALDDLASGRPLPGRVITTRYAAGLPALDPRAREGLSDYLHGFVG